MHISEILRKDNLTKNKNFEIILSFKTRKIGSLNLDK